MAKATNSSGAREKKRRRPDAEGQNEGFQPCSPDMTICGDCADNRGKKKCPRLKEWLSKNGS